MLMRRTPAAASSSRVKRGPADADDDVHRPGHRRTDGPHGVDVGKAGGVEHIGSGRLEALEPPDRVVEIGPAPQEVLGTRREDEIAREAAAGFHGGVDALQGKKRVVDRRFGASGVIFDRASRQPHGGGGADGFGNRLGAVAEAVFEIGRDGQRRCPDDESAMGQHVRPGGTAIAHAAREGHAGAGGGERRKARAGEDAGRADVPWIRQNECARPFMQGPETGGLVVHSASLRDDVGRLAARREQIKNISGGRATESGSRAVCGLLPPGHCRQGSQPWPKDAPGRQLRGSKA